MSRDITERLKDLISQAEGSGVVISVGLLAEALDEIDRLREELKDYREMVASFDPENFAGTDTVYPTGGAS